METDPRTLQEWVAEAAQRLEVPGVAVGVYHDGEEHYAFAGVTSVENPLPVDEDTLFQFGSTGKTFTATAIMRLVDRGLVDLDATVRTYLPELVLSDEGVASAVTVLQLLNHTAGWSGDVFDNTGDGDDALARYVELMANVEQVTPLGSTVSYNNASLSIAGRIIEKVTGKTFEQAIRELLFEPLGLDHCYFFPNEIMTRRFAAGHNQHADGSITVARPWAMARCGSPAGGISSNAGDLITWARFHLGDGRAADGTEVLPEKVLKQMQQATVDTPGSALGDAIGISWLMRDIEVEGEGVEGQGRVRMVGHGGDTVGQHSSFDIVPERQFAVVGLTNCGPNGNQFLDELGRWALETYLGIVERDPEPVALGAEQLADYVGTYETVAAIATITSDDDSGGLVLVAEIKPEALEKLAEEAPENPPFPLGLLPGPGDRYVVTDGPGKGMKGYFVRNAAGAVESVHVGGRLATKVTESTDAAR
jgi:CubicO group peptidase (beta-lactamase class C family)